MNKTLLVTGATSGIGKALALHAAYCGYKVIACGRNKESLLELANNTLISTLEFDVTNEKQTHRVLADLHFDIAVLNAGTCEYVKIDNFEPSVIKRVFDTNFFGVVNTFSALRDKLSAGKQIVIIDSLARLLPFSRCEAYGASKAAVYYFGKSLEVDLAQHGVIVQTISPGFVETPLTDKNDFEMPMKISSRLAATTILNAIESKDSTTYFPRRFSFLLRFFSLLPARIQRNLSLYLKNRQSQ
ncbi:SDR family NAD(P)-dependent oxidoreductase [Alteromonas sp. 5E99-2]|uniref:SDR family NAD(P)-dependent oxidoreductase n=1 Tax=Alteromonas sp. 5E99-2 TaxID=2817683 RepID=UPI001A98C6B8|nr:SDR family NAD(P)-dependent oxidoreductase [Alteromonas sp. 5E99-2]MBO1255271.1 SDR family NAD(P)-dependent oxidoreductase [Alteromonas sp. 5E99-2]